MPKQKTKAKTLRKKTRNSKKEHNIFYRIFRFFFPKDWRMQMYQGQLIGAQLRRGKITPRLLPTYWLGKLARKIIDPRHKMKFGDKKEITNGNERTNSS